MPSFDRRRLRFPHKWQYHSGTGLQLSCPLPLDATTITPKTGNDNRSEPCPGSEAVVGVVVAEHRGAEVAEEEVSPGSAVESRSAAM